MRHPSRLGLTIVLAMVASTAALAQPARLDPLVRALDDTDFDRREEATQRLIQIPGLELTVIERQLARDDLSAEQRVRLNRVAARVFASTPKAGLGVQFDERTEAGVRLLGTVDNGRFPAADILEAGDLLVAVDGRDNPTQDWLRAWILSHRPGEVMTLVVLRGGERLELDVPLGSFDDLGRPGALDQMTLSRSFRLRRERLETPAPGIGADIDADDWIGVSYPTGADRPVDRPPTRLFELDVGGRSATEARAWSWSAKTLDRLHTIALSGRGLPDRLPSDLRDNLVDELIRSREALARRAAGLEDILSRRQLEPDARGDVESRIVATKAEVEVLNRRIEEIERRPGTP